MVSFKFNPIFPREICFVEYTVTGLYIGSNPIYEIRTMYCPTGTLEKVNFPFWSLNTIFWTVLLSCASKSCTVASARMVFSAVITVPSITVFSCRLWADKFILKHGSINKVARIIDLIIIV